ncbi:hypothetical protein HG530_006248 [Fusarium avenaceum]|nr:hypothetical protein HG530_006248 [Fusarium avenaceum]
MLRNKSRLGELTLGCLLVHLALDTVVDSIKHVLNSDAGLKGGLGSVLVNTSLDKDAVPVVIGNLVDSVGTLNVTLRSVTDEVDSVWGSNKAMLSLSPLSHQARSKLKGRNLRLAEGVGMKDTVASSEVLEGNLEHTAEGSHTETDVLVSSRPNNIVVREIEWWALIVGLAAGAETATLGHSNIEHNLDIASPVARIGKYKHSVDDNICKVSFARVGMLLRSELAERSGSSVVLNNVTRGHDVLEAIALSDVSALLAFTTDNKDGAILLSHLPHGSVATDELARLDVAVKLAGEITTSLLFGLTTTVGKENVHVTMLFILWTTPE